MRQRPKTNVFRHSIAGLAALAALASMLGLTGCRPNIPLIPFIQSERVPDATRMSADPLRVTSLGAHRARQAMLPPRGS